MSSESLTKIGSFMHPNFPTRYSAIVETGIYLDGRVLSRDVQNQWVLFLDIVYTFYYIFFFYTINNISIEVLIDKLYYALRIKNKIYKRLMSNLTQIL